MCLKTIIVRESNKVNMVPMIKQHGSNALIVSIAKPKIVAAVAHVHVFWHFMDDFFMASVS